MQKFFNIVIILVICVLACIIILISDRVERANYSISLFNKMYVGLDNSMSDLVNEVNQGKIRQGNMQTTLDNLSSKIDGAVSIILPQQGSKKYKISVFISSTDGTVQKDFDNYADALIFIEKMSNTVNWYKELGVKK